MNPTTLATHRKPVAIILFQAHLVFLCLFAFAITGRSQAPFFQPSSAAWTPLAEQPGAPVGSYPLSGFDSVNLFNGHLNFRLPLMKIGGRGRAGYSMMLNIEQHWQVQTVAVPTCDFTGCTYPEGNYRYIANPIWWTGMRPEFSPGVLQGRQSGSDPFHLPACSATVYDKTLTRLTFIGPDGTEHELRDQQTGGQPLPGVGCFGGPSRGKVFVSADGSATTFISDAPISDDRQPHPGVVLSPSGFLLMKDGTRYRIDNGKTSWIQDANGNRVSFTYSGVNLVGIDDSLNRHITITHGNPTVVSFKGANGVTRTIKVHTASLSTVLRKYPDGSTEYTTKTFAQLFPNLQNPQQGTFDIPVTSAVELPDGRQYQFRYDSYANLAQVILPTGGRIEYDWTTSTYSFADHVFGIVKRVLERRTALNATTSTYETRTTYSNPINLPNNVTVDNLDPKNGNALISRSKHYFHGSSVNNPAAANLYPAWLDGREYQTELFAANGTTVLRRINHTFQQRAAIPWWTGSADASPPNDTRLVETTTALVDTNQISKVTSIDPNNPTGPVGFDQYNNQTKVWEYDFGSGAPGSLLRHTVTSYFTNGYDALFPNSTNPDVSLTAHIRNLPSQISVYDAGGTERGRTTFEYDNYVADSFHANLFPRSDISGHDIAWSTGYTKRGNRTASSRYLLPAGTALTTYAQFDIAGNAIRLIDPRSTAGNVIATNITYDDNFGGPDGSLAERFTFTELGSQKTFAFPTVVINALNQSASTQYDYHLGQAINTQDLNGTIAAGYHIDLLDRLTQIRRAFGTSAENQTTIEYDDDDHFILIKSDLHNVNDNVLVNKRIYDGLGRTIEAQAFEGGGNYITVQTQYDALGRAFRASNPFRPWQSETAVWITQAFDGLGRVTSVTTSDGSIANTLYSGNTVTVTDQAGKKRKTVTDALGRLVEVYEDPDVPGAPTELNFQTTYLYDALDNLIKVTQGTQQRFFMYDSLKRLIRTRNPEQATNASLNLSDPLTSNAAWAMGYEYDAGANITQMTDARGVVSTFGYDSLGRNTTVDYSDTSSINPDVTHLYDGATIGIGKLWSSEAGGTDKTVTASYDELGRSLILQQSFKLPNNTWKMYQTSRTYNVAGSVTTLVYPSNHSVTYNYDAAGRLADKDTVNPAFKGNLGDGGAPRTYSRGITYAVGGEIAQEQFGTTAAVYNKRFYNSRQQLAEILVSTTTGNTWDRGKILNQYSLQCSGANSGASCNATDNNGNLRKQEVFIPNVNPQLPATSWYQQYDYDQLNRLKLVHEYTGNTALDWQQEFDYDRWGNRTINATGTWVGNQNNPPNPLLNETQFDTSILASTNRLQAPGDQALAENQKRMRYDGAGNLINDTYTGAGAREYDAENRMTKAWGGDNQWQFYTYNADGQRTRRKINNQETWQVYGFGGELLAEYPADGATNNPTKEYGYRNGQLLISADAGFSFAPPVFADDFNDNSLNTSFWSTYAPGSPTVSEQGQQLQIALSPNTAGYNGVYSNSTYDLTNRMVQVESVQAVSQAGWCENLFELELNANNYFMIQVGAGNMIFRARVNGVNDQTVIPFDGAANRFWRIRHDQSANLVHFETSAAGSVWLTRKTVTPGFSLTSLRFHLIAGAYGTGNSSPGTAKYDNLKLLTSTTGSVSLTVPNGGFETPVIGNGNWQYAPGGASWSFANGGGITGMNSGFTGVPSTAPQGVQVAFLQGTGEVSQSISGFQAGVDYLITFHAIQRTNCCNIGGQDIAVYVDSIQIGSIHPSGSGYAEYSFPFTTSAGAHTIKFVGLNPLGGDHTAFVDNVRITGSPKPGYGVQWLVADQLGAPRIILDETGSLANAKRHDYFPFGEELLSQGLRSSSTGYATGDGVRQQFTSYERDVESGLDYAHARYYSSTLGRFTGADTPLMDQYKAEPQSWNLYAYVGNNPLIYTDPFGLWKRLQDCEGNRPQCYESDNPDDNYISLAKILKVSPKALAAHFQNKEIKVGDVLDVSGFFSKNKTVEAGPSGTHLEVIIWQPFANLKESILGHVSYNIDFINWSPEKDGWDKGRPFSDYLKENSWRNGVGYVLSDDANPAWAAELAKAIQDYKGKWTPLYSNCGEPFAQAAKAQGLPENNGWLPVHHRGYILHKLRPYITAIVHYNQGKTTIVPVVRR